MTIYHGDCRDVLPALEAVDHVMTDPPYSDDTHEGARTGGWQTLNEPSGVLLNFDSTTATVLRETLALIRLRRWALFTCDWQHVLPLKQCPPAGWRFVRHGAWVKPNGTPQFTGDRPAQGWEAVAILHGGVSGKMRWNGGGLPAVWIYNKVLSDHPTGKPDALLESWVTQFSEPGETILDPYMGAGTTLAAAKKHGRKAVGIEIEERYCEIAARRLAQGSLLGQMLDGLAAHDVIEGEK